MLRRVEGRVTSVFQLEDIRNHDQIRNLRVQRLTLRIRVVGDLTALCKLR
jgi:hypothetical protein